MEVAPFADVDILQFRNSAYSPFPFSAEESNLDADYLEFMPMDTQQEADTTESFLAISMDDPSIDTTSMDPFMSLLDGSIDLDLHQSLIAPDHSSKIERPSSPADQGVLTAYDKMAPLCVSLPKSSSPSSPPEPLSYIMFSMAPLTSLQGVLEPWMLYDPKTPLYNVLKHIKGFTADAAARNATPFMHRYLYRDHTPSCILECFTTNVLYTNRNAANMGMVMRALHRNVNDLVGSEMKRVGATVAEKLARTQALFLYQVIRLFDGDVTLRAQGEKDLPLLQTWLGDLCRIRENLGGLAELEDGLVRTQTPIDWQVSGLAVRGPNSTDSTFFSAGSLRNLYEEQ